MPSLTRVLTTATCTIWWWGVASPTPLAMGSRKILTTVCVLSTAQLTAANIRAGTFYDRVPRLITLILKRQCLSTFTCLLLILFPYM